MSIELSEWVKKMKIFVSYVTACPRISSTEVLWRMQSITKDTVILGKISFV